MILECKINPIIILNSIIIGWKVSVGGVGYAKVFGVKVYRWVGDVKWFMGFRYG